MGDVGLWHISDLRQ